MPSATERITKLREAADDGEIPYISKSRLTTYVKCPRTFYYNYILGIRAPENYYMKKGTRIHLTYEKYYENISTHFAENPTADLPSTSADLVPFLPEDALLWIDWLHPYITNFIYWELDRAEAASSLEEWLPVAIEAEAWDDDQTIPWMGFADAIVPVASIAEIDGDDGVVIVDFKTGSTPDKKYRNKGIFLEGEYYGMLFREDYNVQGVAGYFPKNNDFIVSQLSEKRRQFVRDTIAEIHECGTEKQNYIPDTGPLCRWGPGDDEKCDYYSMCHAGKEWGGPVENEEEFTDMAKAGIPVPKLASQFTNGEVGPVYYWKNKLNV